MATRRYKHSVPCNFCDMGFSNPRHNHSIWCEECDGTGYMDVYETVYDDIADFIHAKLKGYTNTNGN